MRDLLEICVPKDAYDACWGSSPPPYELFLDTVVQKLSDKLEVSVSDLSCTARPNGNNRIRLDGIICGQAGRLNLYADLVWLPALEMFRGTINLTPLEDGEGPLYCGLELESTDEVLIPVFVPPLVTILTELEQKNGSPLTESEVLQIRDNAVCITLRSSVAIEMDKRRGYQDIDPENCWTEWSAIREQIQHD